MGEQAGRALLCIVIWHTRTICLPLTNPGARILEEEGYTVRHKKQAQKERSLSQTASEIPEAVAQFLEFYLSREDCLNSKRLPRL